MPEPSSKHVTEQQQQELDVSHQPDVEPTTSRGSKRQRKQQRQADAAPQPRMSAFEAERAARIAANMARLAALELPQMAAGLAALQPAGKAKAGPSQRGVGSKRKRSDEQQQPVRRSARNKGEAPDPATAGGIDYETRDGSVVLLHGAVGHLGGSSSGAAAAAAAAVAPPGPLPFRSSNGDEASDAAFLALLAAQAAAVSEQQRSTSSSGTKDGTASKRHSSSSSGDAATGQQLSGLRLSAADVAKVTRDGISCLAFHPSSSRLLIAAADKQGKVRRYGCSSHAIVNGCALFHCIAVCSVVECCALLRWCVARMSASSMASRCSSSPAAQLAG
jgi:hypothetical protein